MWLIAGFDCLHGTDSRNPVHCPHLLTSHQLGKGRHQPPKPHKVHRPTPPSFNLPDGPCVILFPILRGSSERRHLPANQPPSTSFAFNTASPKRTPLPSRVKAPNRKFTQLCSKPPSKVRQPVYKTLLPRNFALQILHSPPQSLTTFESTDS